MDSPPRSSRDPHRNEILAELHRIIESPHFAGTSRTVKLIRFLVEETLAGRRGALDAEEIASRVLGRPKGFRTTDDSIVRVEVSKLRRALSRHYEAAPPSGVRIELPRGGYKPVFIAAGTADAQARSVRPSPVSGQRWRAGALPRAPGEGDGPIIAVVPFDAVSVSAIAQQAPTPPTGRTSARSQVIARGMTDRVGALYAMYPFVLVVSHATSLEDARERGARYVLEGSVRVVPGALRVSVKLHDAARGLQIWGAVYDRLGSDEQLFSAEDEIANAIALQTLGLPFGVLHVAEAVERASSPLRSAYEVILRFPRWFVTFDPALQAEIEAGTARFLDEEPDHEVLLAFASLFHSLAPWTGAPGDLHRGLAMEHAQRAMRVAPHLTTSHQALGFAAVHLGDTRVALAEAEAALESGGPLILTGLIFALAGAWERGAEVIHSHIGLLKRYPGAIRHAFALGAYRRGDYAVALTEADAISTPNLAWGPLDRAVSLARLGRLDEAREAGRALVAIVPEAARDPRAFAARVTTDAALVEDLADALARLRLGR